MNSYSLTRIVKSLKEGKKGHFTVLCHTKTREYEFHIFGKVELTIRDLQNKSSVLQEYKDDSFNIPDEDYTIKLIRETIYTSRKEKYSETTLYCLDSVQIYLPVFRVLGEQVVFLLRYGNEVKRMFFINGRVFYFEETDTQVILYQSDLRRVLESFGGEIILFDRLPRKLNYGLLNNLFDSHAKSVSKSFSIVKNGIVIQGDIKN